MDIFDTCQILIIAASIWGLPDHNVILVNNTGLFIARLEIDGKKFEGWGEGSNHGKILMEITPKEHDLRVVFRGGASVDWPHFDFKGVHEVFFERKQNKIEARIE